MRWMSGVVVMVSVSMAAGCHARFKKHAASLGEVRPEVVTTSGPHASLGAAHDASVSAAVINVVQVVKSASTSERLAEAVDPDALGAAFSDGFAQTLGDGPPFAVTTDPSAPVMQVEVLSYGLDVPALGVPGSFTYDLRVSIYDTAGTRVYRATHSCAAGFGDAPGLSVALGTVNNVKQLNEMSDAEIQEVFEVTAYYCGQDLVARVRKHANPMRAPAPAPSSSAVASAD